MHGESLSSSDIEQYRAYLVALANTQIPARMRARLDASDVVQETLIDAHRQRENFAGQPGAQLAIWLRQLLAGKLIDAMRRESRDKRDVRREQQCLAELESTAANLAAFAVSELTSPSMKLARNEVAVQLADALQNLPDSQQQALTMRYLQNQSLAQIAEVMGRTPVAVAGLIKRGVAALRQQMTTKNA